MISIDLLKYQSNKLLIDQYIYRELFRKRLTLYFIVKHRTRVQSGRSDQFLSARGPPAAPLAGLFSWNYKPRARLKFYSQFDKITNRLFCVQLWYDSSTFLPKIRLSIRQLLRFSVYPSLFPFKISLWKIFQILKWHILVLTYYRKVTWLEKIK